MAAKLKEAGKILVPSATAQCISTGVEVDSPLFGGKPEPGDDNDLYARHTRRCAKPEALREVATALFAPTLTPPSNTPLGKPHGARHSAMRPKSVCI